MIFINAIFGKMNPVILIFALMLHIQSYSDAMAQVLPLTPPKPVSTEEPQPPTFKTRPKVIKNHNTKSKTKKEVALPTSTEQKDMFSYATLFIDAAGPVQYQTFAQSELTGENRYDPNLLSFGPRIGLLWLAEYLQHGPQILLRFFRQYENTIASRYPDSSETLIRNISVSSLGYGIGYSIQRPLQAGEHWYPALGINIERSDVKVTSDQNGTSFSSQGSYQVNSTLLFSYLTLGNEWYFFPGNIKFGFGLNLYFPLKGRSFDSASNNEELKLSSELDHKMSRGLGLTFNLGWWM